MNGILSSVLLLLFVFTHSHSQCQKGGKPRELFDRFIKQYNKPYIYGSKVYEERFGAFKYNLQWQEKLNANRSHNHSAQYGITKFSDLYPEEFSARYLSNLSPSPSVKHLVTTSASNSNFIVNMDTLPSKLDWREKKVLGPVRNQKACGGCWAFSVVEATEAVYAIRTHGSQHVALSVQEVIDCSHAFEGALWGCKGGQICAALKWLKQKDVPLVLSSEYPLTDESESCNLNLQVSKGVHVSNFSCYNLVEQENIIKSLLIKGPVAVSVDATSWPNYIGGIIQFHCGGFPNNHAVIIVGYDTTGDIPYYIVMNSWGTDFGDKGFIYIRMGGNLCGLAQEVSTLDVAV